jgi:MFS family permease
MIENGKGEPRSPGKTDRIWSRFFVLLLVVDLAAYLAHYMLLTSLPAFTAHIGGTAADAGILAGSFTLAGILLRPLFGMILDARGRRIVLTLGAVVLVVTTALYPIVTLIPLLVLLRFVHGGGFSAYTTAAGTVLADIVPKTRLAEGIGYVGIAGTVATALGPVIGNYLAVRDFNLLFVILVALGLACLAGAFWMDYERKGIGGSVEPPLAPRKGRFFEKSALWVSLVAFFVCFPLDAVMIYMQTYGASRGFENIGLFFPVHAVGMVLTYLFLGRMVDRVGPGRIFVPSLLLVVASFVLLAVARGEWVVGVAAFLFGVGLGLIGAILRAMVIRLSPPDSLGAANATYMTASDLGFGLGAVSLGALVQTSGFTAFYLVSAGFGVLALGLYLIALRPQLARHRLDSAQAIAQPLAFQEVSKP